MGDSAVFAALRTLATSAITGSTDRSDDPNAVDPKAGPEIVVELERTSAERISMESAEFDVQATAQIEVFRRPTTPASARTEGQADASAIADAIASSAALEAVTVDFSVPTTDVQVAEGEYRVVKATATISIQYIA